MRARKAFIFTSDAVLAFYLITILISILLILSYSPVLYTEQSQSLAGDTLAALDTIKLADVIGNPQYNYTNSLLSMQTNSIHIWPMFERTTDHNSSVLSVYPTSNSLWIVYPVGHQGAITGVHSTPIVYYGKIIATSENGTKAFDENTGNLLWLLPIPSDSTPITYNGHIFVNSLTNITYSIDERGQVIWNATFNSTVLSSPIVHDGKVFIGLVNGSLLGFDVESGAAVNWVFTALGNITSTPAIYNRTIILFSSEKLIPGISNAVGHLYSIDEGTGAMVWNYTTSMANSINLFVDPSPLVANGVVYFSNEQTIDAVNATNGLEMPSPTGGWPVQRPWVTFTSSPVFDNGKLYVGCTFPGSAGICVIDTTTQSLDAYSMNNPVYTPVVVANDSLIVASAGVSAGNTMGTVMVVNKMDPASVLWSYNTSQPIYSPPALVNGKIYIGANDGNIYSFGNCSLLDSNMSVIDAIAGFWSINRTDCARAVAKEFLDSAVPQNYGFELVVKPIEGTGLKCTAGIIGNCSYCNGTSSADNKWDSIYTNDCNETKYQRLLIRDSRYISGVSEKSSTIYYNRNPIEVEFRMWD